MSDPLSFLLWPEHDKCDFMDYAVEPSALSFYDPAALFPFTFDPGSPSDSSSSLQSSSSGRRLSTSSSASSLSPAPPAESDAAALLAERVRQSAGVMLALPMPLPLNPQPPPLPPKLPIPRLPRPVSQPPSSSAASTPPPSTPSPQPRSKTSHTTIERRYRTNLNARIQSLRMAVPALRVVDDRDPTKNRAPNKVLVSADPPRPSTLGDDVVDERGFVDGVKVARKCSKANVLGKAVEYIRVLKRREARLKNEQAGLKSLVAGLVGGPALLKEWEREWREMFGGEEKDEVDPEAEADDDDDDDDDNDNDDDGGRKRKRSKVAHVKPEKKVASSPDGTVPEKRKRGRPRKVVPPPTVPAEHPQQYLLATFALFSFFNSPLTSFSTVHVHTHTGTVLNGSPGPLATDNTRLSYWLHLLHLLVSTLILVRCVSSWAGIKFNLSPSISILTALSRTAQNHKDADTEKRTLTHWIRLAESFVFSPHTHRTLLPRVQAYHRITTEPSASPSDMCTALLALYGCGTPLGGIARARARKVWREWLGVGGREYERLVFEMGVDEAVGCVGVFGAGAGVRVRGEDGDGDWTPMRVLGTMIVMRRMRACLGGWFVGVVCGRDGGGDGDGGKGEGGEREYRRTVEAARELGGYVGELGRRFERLLCGAGAGGELREENDDDGVGALMDAVVLYRRVFGGAGADGNAVPVSVSMPPSPPPSPGRKAMVRARVRDEDVGRLRRALGSRVFEETEALEDARDRAVDRVVEFERWSMGLRHEV
ncbi:hypothetical protein E4T56_gene10664 [Termitomyces sp. T112]|nr:hypothetical protein E4T56_gene10664 [Termitomyces sp. T112]